MALDPRSGIVTETSKQVGSFFTVMKEQPLSLALVVMNFALIGYLFYAGSSQMSQRQETAEQIIKWQQATDTLMANCVSKEVMLMVLQAMERAHKREATPEPK